MRRGWLIGLGMWVAGVAAGQSAPGAGVVVPDFRLPKVLNQTSPLPSFSSIKKKLTILDFFGTWCVPCIRALPNLSSIQKTFPTDIAVVLVSIEAADKLQSFIAKRQPFPFPVVIDEGNVITNLFQPPAYPYTVVLNERGKIVAITEAAGITEATVKGWLSDTTTAPTVTPLLQSDQNKTVSYTMQKSSNVTVALSQDFLYAVKTDDAAQEGWKAALQNLDYQTLKTGLTTDKEKVAFWVNIYNGYSNALLKKNPEKYSNRNRFFKAKQVPVAGKLLSLDEIEHDFLRRTKIKWSLGHLNKLFPSRTAKELRVEKLDYRIHFALNCGAKSCPPIAFYDPQNLDAQLDAATKNYLTNEVENNSAENRVYLPAIMSWFRADFGGKRGMRTLLKGHGLLPQDASPKIRFKKYDWSLQLNNYKTE